jgi:carbamoyl-phosphate synthase large subunit
MGIDRDFGLAFAKSQEASGQVLPRGGTLFISVKSSLQRHIIFMVKKLAELGFRICASEGTAKVLRSNGVNAKMVPKIGEGKPDIIDLIKAREIDLIINVPSTKRKSQSDSKPIRSAAVMAGITYITTIEGAQAAVAAMDSLGKTGMSVKSIQEYASQGAKRGEHYKHDLEFRTKMWG